MINRMSTNTTKIIPKRSHGVSGSRPFPPLVGSKRKYRPTPAVDTTKRGKTNKSRQEDKIDEKEDEDEDDEDFEIPIDINVTDKAESFQRRAAEGKLKIYTQPSTTSNNTNGHQRENIQVRDDATDLFDMMDDGYEDGDKDDESDDDVITVDFGLYDPIPNDDLTFRMLLKDYIQDDSCFTNVTNNSSSSTSKSSISNQLPRFALNEFCSLISNQFNLGSTIKGEGTDEPLGLLTALSFHTYANTLPFKQLTAFLIKHAPSSLSSTVKSLLTEASNGVESVSLLVNDRLVNVPSELVSPLHTALVDDIKWASDNEVDEKKQKDLNISKFILIGRCFDSQYAAQSRLSKNLGDGTKKGKKKKNQEESKKSNHKGEMLYYRFEEELFAKKADWKYHYKYQYNQREGEIKRRELPQECVVMCLNREAIKSVVKELAEMPQ